MIDANFTPVLVMAGFNEQEHPTVVNDGGNAYDAVGLIMADKEIARMLPTIDTALLNQAEGKHKATEPKESVIKWAEWHLKVIREVKPYESVVMAVGMLQPSQRAALRARVLSRLRVPA